MDRCKFSDGFLKVFVLCLFSFLTACTEQDPQRYVQDGIAILEQGDFDSARLQFKNALQIDPTLAEAYYGLALLEERKQNWKAMFQALQDTVALDSKHLQAQLKLGQLYLLQNQADKAKEAVENALAIHPRHSEALLLRSAVLLREGKNSAAKAQIEQVLAADGNNSDALLAMVNVLLADKAYDEALALLERGIKHQPDNIALWLLKIRLHTELKHHSWVAKDFAQLVARQPHNKALRDTQIDWLCRIGLNDQAEQALRDAIAQNPDDIDFTLRLVGLQAPRNPAQAEATLTAFALAHPDNVGVKSRIAKFYADSGRLEDEQRILNTIVAVDTSGEYGLAGRIRLAELAWAKHDKPAAENRLNEVLALDSGNSAALLLRAVLRIDDRNADAAISDLRIVLRENANSEQALVMMARAQMLKGETEVAESYWRKALEINPANLDALSPLIVQLLKRHDAVRAEELLRKAMVATPDSPILLELLIRARAERKDWAGAETALAELKALAQGQDAAELWSGRLAGWQGRHAEAVQSFKQVLVRQPGSEAALSALISSYEAEGQRKQAIAYLESFLQRNPNSVAGYTSLGRLYGAEKQLNDAERMLRRALQGMPDALPIYIALADVLQLQGKVAEIETLYRQRLQESPDWPELQFALARYYEQNQKRPQAIALYQVLAKEFPGNDEVSNNLADLLASGDPDPDNITQAVALVSRFEHTKNPYYLDTYGWVAYKAGDTAKAVIALKAAAALASEIAAVHYHLAEVYTATGDIASAKVELKRALELAQLQGGFNGIERATELLNRLGG